MRLREEKIEMKRRYLSAVLAASMVMSSMSGMTVFAKTTDPEISEREIQNSEFSAQIAAEGMVLLGNNDLSDGKKSLPISTKTVALFGTGAVATIKGGRGSGAVNNRETKSLYQALVENGYTVTTAGTDPSDPGDYIMKYVDELERQSELENGIGNYIVAGGGLGVAGAIETEVTDEMIEAGKKDCDTAIYIIARDSGENCEKSNVPGDYYVSELEYKNLRKVAENFENVIVMFNTGNAIDTNFFNGKSPYSAEEGEYVKMNLPDNFAFDADQFDREKHMYYVPNPEEGEVQSIANMGFVNGVSMTLVPEDAEFDYDLADPVTDKTSISSTAGYYYWDPQYGTENTALTTPRYRSVIFNHYQDFFYTYNSETDTYEPVAKDVRYDKDTDYYMYNVFRKIEGLDSLLYVSQAGQNGGQAIVDILNGTTSPSGKLADTIPVDYYDLPSSQYFAHNDGVATDEDYIDDIYVGYRYFDTFGVEPAYPFGYGQSYTTFETKVDRITVDEVSAEGNKSTGKITVTATVTNTGDTAGKEVVEVYYSVPATELDEPAKELADYAKTDLLQPGESQTVEISFDIADMASYDMETSTYILPAGEYVIRVGNSSRDHEEDAYNTLKAVGKLSLSETTAIQQLKTIERGITTVDGILVNDGSKSIYAGEDTSDLETVEITFEDGYETPTVEYNSEDTTVYVSDSTMEQYAKYLALDGIEEIVDGAEGEVSYEAYVGDQISYKVNVKKFDGDYSQYTLKDVKEGTISLEEFVSAMTVEELSNLVVGQTGSVVKGAAGETYQNAEKGITPMVFTDGPAGIRITPEYQDENDGNTYYQYCTAWPVGALVAMTWDKDLIRQMGASVGDEMLEMGSTLWLAPGMNLHRNPLCGRGFEYYSEDPVVTGTTASYITMGVQYGADAEPTDENYRGIGVTLKHYYGNQQETFRQFTNNNITERAVRELYLKAFQMAVEDANATAIMTSYNLNQGIPDADDYDLCTVLPREEWGFDGLIMTDWGGGSATPGIMMHAGNDLVMPGRAPQVITTALEGTALRTGKQEEQEGPEIRVSIGDVQKSAMHILNVVMNSVEFENSLTAEATENTEEKQISFEIADEFNNIVNAIELKVGATAQNKARTVEENVEVTYTSSDESVATVDENGTVTAVAAGTATIRASLSETQYAEYHVTVTE